MAAVASKKTTINNNKSNSICNNNNNNIEKHSKNKSLSKMLGSPAHNVGLTNGAGGIMALHHTPTPAPHARTSLFDSCHRKIRFIGSSPFTLFGTLVA